MARIRVIGPGLVAEVQVISIGDRQWETNVLTGDWQKLPPGWGFNPAALFDPQGGIHPVLENDLQDLELAGLEALEELPGARFYLLCGEVDGRRLYDLSYGMMGPDAMDLRLWIAPDSFDLVRLEITDQRPDQEQATIWRIDFWDFGNVVEIDPPDVQEEGDDG
jgi:lipoprotein LprG